MLVKGLHLSNVMKKNKRCSKRLENNAYKVKEMTIKKKTYPFTRTGRTFPHLHLRTLVSEQKLKEGNTTYLKQKNEHIN